MPFVKGTSGNPRGKPKGAGDRSTEIRNLLHANAAALAQKAVDMALAGDPVALRICLERLCPALKARDAPVQLEFPEGAKASEQGRAILAAMAEGRLTPDQATALLGALGGQARLIEADELAARITVLEASVAARPSGRTFPVPHNPLPIRPPEFGGPLSQGDPDECE